MVDGMPLNGSFMRSPVSKETHVVAAVLFQAQANGFDAAHPNQSSARVLVAKRPAGKSNGGLWEFPGGKVEAGESHREALVREIREELGCEVAVGPLLASVAHDYPFGRIILHAYLCTGVSGEPTALEHEELAFADAGALTRLAFAPANLPIVELVRDRLREDHP